MDFSEIEKSRCEISSIIPRFSGTPKILLLKSFYTNLISTDNNLLIQAFSSEFIQEFLDELENYSPFNSEPAKTIELQNLLLKLINVSNLETYKNQIEIILQSMENKLKLFLSFLNGGNIYQENNEGIHFPLVGIFSTSFETISFSTIEKIRIKITPTSEKDSFIFVPSNQKKDQLDKQVRKSFEIAKNYIKEYKNKLNKYHEVLIYFENVYAEYGGNSLGIALTVGLIEQLSICYNLPFLIRVQNKFSSTGGMDENGNVTSVGVDNIRKKVSTVFYSRCETFVIPKADELPAEIMLSELNKIYPFRKLKIVPVQNLEDLLNRRNLIDIKKQSPVDRTLRSIKKNWIATTLAVVIILIAGFIWIRDYDDNPAQTVYETDDAGESTLYIKNKSGKILWSKPFLVDRKFMSSNYLRTIWKLIDINNDGKNELILSNEILKGEKLSKKYGRVVCLDHNGKEIWDYLFKDTISSYGEKLSPAYNIGLIDTVTINNKRILFLMCCNGPSFSSAIFKLDLLTGKRLAGTFWHAGFIRDGLIGYFDNDHQIELVFGAISNAFERGIFGVMNVDSISGQAPATKYYTYKNIPLAKLKSYIELPRTDYNRSFMNLRGSAIPLGCLTNNEKEDCIRMASYESIEPVGNLVYEIKYNWKDINIVIGNELRLLRDTLVVHGKLKHPLTDTPEYCSLLIDQIRYWNGKKFVRKAEL